MSLKFQKKNVKFPVNSATFLFAIQCSVLLLKKTEAIMVETLESQTKIILKDLQNTYWVS